MNIPNRLPVKVVLDTRDVVNALTTALENTNYEGVEIMTPSGDAVTISFSYGLFEAAHGYEQAMLDTASLKAKLLAAEQALDQRDYAELERQRQLVEVG